MNTDTIIINLQKFFSERDNRIRLLIGLIIIIVISSAISFLGYFSIISVSYEHGQARTDEAVRIYSYQAIPEQRNEINSVFGLVIIPRSTESLLFTSGRSEVFVSPPEGIFPFGFSSMDIALKEPVEAKKISSGGRKCPVINDSGVYSYHCSNPTLFEKYVEKPNGMPEFKDSGRFSSTYPPARYQKGILILGNVIVKSDSKISPHAITYLQPGTDKVASIGLPRNFYNANQYMTIYTDKTNQQNKGFVVYNYNTGIGYYYRELSKNVQPKRIKRLHTLNIQEEESSCVLMGQSLACYHGHTSEGSHNHGDEEGIGDKEALHGGVIEITNLDQETPAVKSYTNPEATIDELHATASGDLFVRNGFALEKVDLQDDTFTTSLVIGNSRIAASGSALYYMLNNKVYEYSASNGHSTLRYYNPGEKIESLVEYGSQLLILSYNHKDPVQLLNVYEMKSAEQ